MPARQLCLFSSLIPLGSAAPGSWFPGGSFVTSSSSPDAPKASQSLLTTSSELRSFYCLPYFRQWLLLSSCCSGSIPDSSSSGTLRLSALKSCSSPFKTDLQSDFSLASILHTQVSIALATTNWIFSRLLSACFPAVRGLQ